MIQLTAEDVGGNCALFLDPKYITTIIRNRPGKLQMLTHVCVVGSDDKGWNVQETPEQILELINNASRKPLGEQTFEKLLNEAKETAIVSKEKTYGVYDVKKDMFYYGLCQMRTLKEAEDSVKFHAERSTNEIDDFIIFEAVARTKQQKRPFTIERL